MASMVHATQKRAPANAAIFGFTEFVHAEFSGRISGLCNPHAGASEKEMCKSKL